MRDHLSQLEEHIHGLVAHDLPYRSPLRYARDGFAQGVLLDHLAMLGYDHTTLPPLQLYGVKGEPTLFGSRFSDEETRAGYEAYADSAGEALARAAYKALTAAADRQMAG